MTSIIGARKSEFKIGSSFCHRKRAACATFPFWTPSIYGGTFAGIFLVENQVKAFSLCRNIQKFKICNASLSPSFSDALPKYDSASLKKLSRIGNFAGYRPYLEIIQNQPERSFSCL